MCRLENTKYLDQQRDMLHAGTYNGQVVVTTTCSSKKNNPYIKEMSIMST